MQHETRLGDRFFPTETAIVRAIALTTVPISGSRKRMLRITQNTHVNVTTSLYATADYDSEKEELAGRWRGGVTDSFRARLADVALPG
jgi:hypothetical protein